MRVKSFQLAVMVLLVSWTLCNEIVDFSYSQIVQNNHEQSDQSNHINILPSQRNQSYFSFPRACYLHKLLDDSSPSASTDIAPRDLDHKMQHLKEKIIEMLTLSQRIRKIKLNIKELTDISSQNQIRINVETIDQELQLLKAQELQLENVNNEIIVKIAILEEKIANIVKESQNYEFSRWNLKFEIQALTLKISYLNNLRKRAQNAADQEIHIDYDGYFKDLKEKFQFELEGIEHLKDILIRFNDLTKLKAKLSQLETWNFTLSLSIEEKQDCHREAHKLIENQKKTSQIDITMATLKQLKLSQGTTPNIYCEGVAFKLEMQIKKVLKIYNYTFACGEGKEVLQKNLTMAKQQIIQTRHKIEEIERLGSFERYLIQFKDNRTEIQTKFKEIKEFKINPYHHNVNDIDQLIKKAQERKKEAELKMQNFPVSKTDESWQNRNQIKILVIQIKTLKAKYCELNEKYERKSQQIMHKVYKYQEEQRFSFKIRQMLKENSDNLQKLQREFENIRGQIDRSL